MNDTVVLPTRIIAWVAAVFAVTVLLASCGTATRWEQPWEPAQTTSSAGNVPQSARSARGNPAFYEVMGRRYHVLSSSAGYRERGVASWYGSKFHGKPTSSGETYDMYGMTAAHKTLPLPTRVRVTNLRNGRSVVVTVNDRGPFVDDRLIDMSYAAAMQLDMIGTGTAPVEVVALDSAPAAVVTTSGTPAKAAPAESAGTSGMLYLQVGAFGERHNATELKQRLEANGFGNVLIHEDSNGSPALYRVRLGPIDDIEEYDALVRQVAALDIRDTHLVTDL